MYAAPATVGDVWDTQTFIPILAINAGETVLRTRLNWFMVFKQETFMSGGLDIQPQWYQNSIFQVGLWGNKAVDDTVNPPAADASDPVPSFIQWGMMMPYEIREFYDRSSNAWQEGLYTFNQEVSDSRGRRGPWQVNGTLWAVWRWGSTTLWWTGHDTFKQGYIGGTINLSALVLSAS